MEGIVNTLLPARMFVVCPTVSYGNEFKSAKAKSKFLLFSASSYCAELEAVCNGVQRNGILLEIWFNKTHCIETILFIFIPIKNLNVFINQPFL